MSLAGPDNVLCGEEKFSAFSSGNDRENVWRRKIFGVFHQFSAFFIIFRGARKIFRDLSQRLFGQVMQSGSQPGEARAERKILVKSALKRYFSRDFLIPARYARRSYRSMNLRKNARFPEEKRKKSRLAALAHPSSDDHVRRLHTLVPRPPR